MSRLFRGLIRLAVLSTMLVGLAACADSLPRPAPTVPATVTATVRAATATPFVQVIDTPGPSALTREVDDYLNKLVAQQAFSGVVLLAKDGKVVHLKGYGMADAEKGVPNTPQTVFQIGSMTKAFTAAAIMMLQEEGKLSVQDPMCKYVEGCPAEWQAITIHHLLTHTSGIPEPAAEAPNPASPTPVPSDVSFEQLFSDVKGLPLQFEPGSQFLYSNIGYMTLGYIVEQVSGEKYADFVSQHILALLGMAHSSFGPAASGDTGRATGYSQPGKRAPAELRSIVFAAGGMFSTAGDLYLWDQALYANKLLSKASLDAIFTPNLQEYGYGWFVIKEGAFGGLITHAGQIPGFVSSIDRYVDSHGTVIMLSNDELANTGSITPHLAYLLFKQR